MHHVLAILLHRPFVADGHLYNTSRSISVDSLMKCASAASSISSLLRAYHGAFSTRRAPYLISYATYVAATIHCRIAGKRGPDSIAHANLVTCLAVFQENKETNSAVQKAAMIIQRLMKKHGVTVDEISSDALEMHQPSKSRDQDHEPGRIAERAIPRRSVSNIEQENRTNFIPNTHNAATAGNIENGYSPSSDWMDIDGIIQSFLQESDANRTRLLADDTEEAPNQIRAQRMPLQGNTQPVARGGFPVLNQALEYGVMPGGVQPADAAYNGYEWQQGWWPPNAEAASLEDPLFGFNGSSLDSFSFLGS